jgi:hypothetical protein
LTFPALYPAEPFSWGGHGAAPQLFFDCSTNPASQFALSRFIPADEMSTFAALATEWFKELPVNFHGTTSLQGNDHEQARR